MNKKFFNGRRKNKKRKTRKKRGGVYCKDINTKKECLENLPDCYWKPINLKHYSGTKMSKKFGICVNQKSRKKEEMSDNARIRRKNRISNKTKSKSNNRTPSEILKIKSKNRADVLIDMMDDFKKFDTPRVNSCCTISGGRKKKTRKMRGGWNGEDCPICVEKMLDESKVINVHVGSKNSTIGPHYFHKTCINNWKKYDRRAECPSCREIMEYRKNDALWPMGAAYTQATTGEFMKCAECKDVLTEEQEVRVISGEAPQFVRNVTTTTKSR